MVYPSNTFEKLGFLEIKALIRERCLTKAAAELVDKVQPLFKYDQIDKFLRQTSEFATLLQHDQPLVMEPLFPIQHLIEKSRVEGTFLLEEEFYHLQLTLRTIQGILKYFKDREGLYPFLEEFLENSPADKTILRELDKVLDEKGKIRSNATPELAKLSDQLFRSEQEARKKLDQVFKHAQSQGWTADGNLTIRDGRLCIPILAENKRKLKGYVHDESASGQTAYLEPEEVFQLNTKIRDLEFEIRREIVRILTSLTDFIRPHHALLERYHRLLTKLDFVRAKASFANGIEAVMPELSRAAELHLVNAEHPLLKISFRKEHPQQSVVPLNLKIDEVDRVLVVSGPNAGGKSVCMKTVGLLQMMVQSGILIPVDPSSRMGVFKSFFADIGDDQSIESDLSTYSAHLTKMKYFTQHADDRSLILIDEFGTGTDPQFGGPMAEAVLEVLNRKKVKGVVTTHYSNLKVYAGNTEGLQNASMLFDHQAMQPQYILQIGKPGSSYAFEIAEKIGLSSQIIGLAKQKVGKNQKKVDTLLIDLEKEKNEILDQQRRLAKETTQIERLKLQNQELQNYLETNKKTILKQAKEEAREILIGANRLVENTISEIKKQDAEKEVTKNLRDKLNQEKKRLESHDKPKIAKSASALDADDGNAELVVGDWVRILDGNNEAQVIEISKNNVILALGELRTVKKRNQVAKLTKKEVKKSPRKSSVIKLQDELNTFSPDIDVRGMRTEEALYAIEKEMDRALMLGHPYLRILHGKGNGILRKFIRDYFRKYGQISRFEDEHVDRGGDGITYAYFS